MIPARPPAPSLPRGGRAIPDSPSAAGVPGIQPSTPSGRGPTFQPDQGEVMQHRIKKFLMYTLVAFVVFYLFSRPAQAANAVSSVFDGVINGANQLAVFFTNVLA